MGGSSEMCGHCVGYNANITRNINISEIFIYIYIWGKKYFK